ncbi:MAG: hypothetical protein RMX65_022525 [Nostoc sp. DedQUE01]|nr:hypothetical protein [Nostoc sp. DedQUE01]
MDTPGVDFTRGFLIYCKMLRSHCYPYTHYLVEGKERSLRLFIKTDETAEAKL